MVLRLFFIANLLLPIVSIAEPVSWVESVEVKFENVKFDVDGEYYEYNFSFNLVSDSLSIQLDSYLEGVEIYIAGLKLESLQKDYVSKITPEFELAYQQILDFYDYSHSLGLNESLRKIDKEAFKTIFSQNPVGDSLYADQRSLQFPNYTTDKLVPKGKYIIKVLSKAEALDPSKLISVYRKTVSDVFFTNLYTDENALSEIDYYGRLNLNIIYIPSPEISTLQVSTAVEKLEKFFFNKTKIKLNKKIFTFDEWKQESGQKAEQSVVNLFFINEDINFSVPALGLSVGIPGPLSFSNDGSRALRKSVILHSETLKTDTSNIITHEILHYLGLEHVCVSTGVLFGKWRDRIDDTSCFPVEDEGNIMFDGGMLISNVFRQGITKQQLQTLYRNLNVQIHKSN